MEICLSCGEDLDVVYAVANCENVCDNCCPKIPHCQDCIMFDLDQPHTRGK